MKQYTPILIAVVALLAIALSLLTTCKRASYRHKHTDAGPGTQQPNLTAAPAQTFDDLLDAIEWVESRGDADAKGDEYVKYTFGGCGPVTIASIKKTFTLPSDCGPVEWVQEDATTVRVYEYRAIGSFQIWKIYVDDVNQILLLGHNPKYTPPIPFAYGDRLNPACSRKMVTIYLNHYGGTFEEMARKHNGGPNGHNKESTKAYWLKVKARMDGVK